jgi:hypothetical protein
MFSPEIQCLEHQILGNYSGSGSGSVSFRVRNNVGQMASFTFSAVDIATDAVGNCADVTDGGVNIKAGRIMQVNCIFPKNIALPVGDRRKFEVLANYTKSGGAYTTHVKGEIYGVAK